MIDYYTNGNLYFLPANLSTEGYSDLLSEYPAGVYFGWAGLSARGVFKMVMSIGWNPYFNNKEKAIVSALLYTSSYNYLPMNFHIIYAFLFQEPWLLHDFNEDFYGEELRLVIVGYIRPEVQLNEYFFSIIFLPVILVLSPIYFSSFTKIGHCAQQVNFSSLESLVAKIHEDRRVAERALDLPLYSSFKNDSYLRSS